MQVSKYLHRRFHFISIFFYHGYLQIMLCTYRMQVNISDELENFCIFRSDQLIYLLKHLM